jgi:hypothetical protein
MAKNAPTQGYLLARVQTKNTTNATLVKAAPATLYGYSLHNSAAAAVHVKVYDKTSAPTVGTDAPWFTISIPANQSTTIPLPDGLPSSRGFGWAATTGAADSDTGALVAADTVTGYFLYV